MVEYWSTMVSTGNGDLGFDSGQGPENRLLPPMKAAGALVIRSFIGEVVTKHSNRFPIKYSNWNDNNLNSPSTIHWMASLVNVCTNAHVIKKKSGASPCKWSM